MLGNQNWSFAITETFLVVFLSRVTASIMTQGDTAIHWVLLLPRDHDLDLGRRWVDLDLDLSLTPPLSREGDLGRLLDGDLFLSPRFQVLLEDLELDVVTDFVLSEAEIETLRDRESSLTLLVLSASFGFLAPSTVL